MEHCALLFYYIVHLFPFLASGTKLTVADNKLTAEIVYDVSLPKSSKHIGAYNNPLYVTGITGNHHRPDICINLYSKKSGWYIGSFILECKYRKLSAFWYGKTWSSREQIVAYHNDSKSPIFFDGHFNAITSIRPVQQVIVLTPDVFENKDDSDLRVSLATFKPSPGNSYTTPIINKLFQMINQQQLEADHFFETLQNKE